MKKQEKMVFCTLFDSNYLDKGLALYLSMKKNIDIFRLYIFAFDDRCFEILTDMKLENVIVILAENDIMTPMLQEVQRTRSRAEFCWTCTPLVIEHVLLKYREKICTYIDADIYFFADPVNMIEDIIDQKKSVGLVAHRFERNYDYGNQIFSVGKYCVQFNTFVNDKAGLQVLENWKRDCLEWCYHRYEDGRFGDQKYLDKWQQMYSCIYESMNLGAGVAPWNLHLYLYLKDIKGKIWLQCKGKNFPLIFYHFEGIKYLSEGKIFLNIWNPSPCGTGRKIKRIYGEYLGMIRFVRKFLVRKYGISFEKLTVDRNIYMRNNYSLGGYCGEDGLLLGTKRWWTHRKNNIF